MCRVDDDCSWMVGGKTERVVPDGGRVQCEDCLRIIGAGETYEDFLEDEDGENDERDFVLVASHGGAGPWDQATRTAQHWAQPSYDVVGPCVDDVDMSDLFEATFEALGFYVSEERDPRVIVPPVWHAWCLQCRAANEWLVRVCHQTTVIGVREDLNEHMGDYSLSELGISFGRLIVLLRHGWRTRGGTLIDVTTIEALTARAVADAERTGLVHA
jgi:hypothetical protein